MGEEGKREEEEGEKGSKRKQLNHHLAESASFKHYHVDSSAQNLPGLLHSGSPQ